MSINKILGETNMSISEKEQQIPAIQNKIVEIEGNLGFVKGMLVELEKIRQKDLESKIENQMKEHQQFIFEIIEDEKAANKKIVEAYEEIKYIKTQPINSHFFNEYIMNIIISKLYSLYILIYY